MAELYKKLFSEAEAEITEAHWRDVTGRLAQATAILSELHSQGAELVGANLRLRHELSEATLALFLGAAHQ